MNIVSANIIITDHTKPGRTLLDLIQNGSGNGYTYAGVVQSNVGWSKVGYRSIQLDSGGPLYIGDGKTANDGSQQGLILSSSGLTGWDRDDYGSPIGLEIYVRTSADNSSFNLMIEGE